ncbi:MAG: M48 family metallopeptidase [Pseudomonadota bacterium]|nr:M48 family metallopeptidase [Pseudomonadota bacterium]
MRWLTYVFFAAVAAETAVRLWLATRQVHSVEMNRERVPELFRDQIAPSDQRRAADYTVARVRFGRWATLSEAAIKLLLTVGGGLAGIEILVDRWNLSEPWRGAVLVLSVMLALQLIGLPFALYRIFRIEARFGFNRTTLRLFWADFAKRLLLGFALGGPLLLVTLTLMQRAGTWWWMWTWAVWQAATLALTWAAPRFIAPLFNRFAPLRDQALKARLQRLLERCGFDTGGGVFVMDGSKRSAHGNAYFTGVGRNKRIVFLDTLLARIDPEELEAVLAHELAHFRLHHVRHQLLLSMFASLIGLALLSWLARHAEVFSALGVRMPSAAMTLLLGMVVGPVFLYFVTPLKSWWSRRQELAADDFAARHSNADQLAGALVKLYRDNASTLTPDRLHSAFYDSHPPAQLRIERLRSLAPPIGVAGLAAAGP